MPWSIFKTVYTIHSLNNLITSTLKYKQIYFVMTFVDNIILSVSYVCIRYLFYMILGFNFLLLFLSNDWNTGKRFLTVSKTNRKYLGNDHKQDLIRSETSRFFNISRDRKGTNWSYRRRSIATHRGLTRYLLVRTPKF